MLTECGPWPHDTPPELPSRSASIVESTVCHAVAALPVDVFPATADVVIAADVAHAMPTRQSLPLLPLPADPLLPSAHMLSPACAQHLTSDHPTSEKGQPQPHDFPESPLAPQISTMFAVPASDADAAEPNATGMIRLLKQLVQQVDALSTKVEEQQATIHALNRQLRVEASAPADSAPTSELQTSSTASKTPHADVIPSGATNRSTRDAVDRTIHAAVLIATEEERRGDERLGREDSVSDGSGDALDRDSENDALALLRVGGVSSPTPESAAGVLEFDIDPYAEIPRIVYVPDEEEDDPHFDTDDEDMHQGACLEEEGDHGDAPLSVPILDHDGRMD